MEIEKLRIMKYKEVVKNSKGIRCLHCCKEYKPAVFRAHLKVKCNEERHEEIPMDHFSPSQDVEVHEFLFDAQPEVKFILRDEGIVTKSFEHTI